MKALKTFPLGREGGREGGELLKNGQNLGWKARAVNEPELKPEDIERERESP